MVNMAPSRIALLVLLAGTYVAPAQAEITRCLPNGKAYCYSGTLPAHKDHWIELNVWGAGGTLYSVTDADNGVTVYQRTLNGYGFLPGGSDYDWRRLYRVYSRYYLYMRNTEYRGEFGGYLRND